MEMQRIDMQIIGTAGAGFDLYLVSRDPQGLREIVAKASLAPNSSSVDFAPSSADIDAVEDAATQARHEIHSIEAASGTALANFRAFRNMDFRASLLDAAYNFVQSHLIPLYEKGSIETEDDTLVLMADGLAAAPNAARGSASGNSGSATGSKRRRPKSRKQQVHSWF